MVVRGTEIGPLLTLEGSLGTNRVRGGSFGDILGRIFRVSGSTGALALRGFKGLTRFSSLFFTLRLRCMLEFCSLLNDVHLELDGG